MNCLLMEGHKTIYQSVYYPIQKLKLNICKPLDLTINSQEMQEVEELVKSQYHQNVDCGTIYMTKEPGSFFFLSFFLYFILQYCIGFAIH